MADNDRTHSGSRRSIDKAEDATAAAVGQVSARLKGGETYHFATNALLGDIYKIEAARLALKRSRSPQVQDVPKAITDVHGCRKMTCHILLAIFPRSTRSAKRI